MTRRLSTPAAAIAALLLSGACTTAEAPSSTGATPDSITAPTWAPVAADSPLDELLSEIQQLMADLDERIITEDDHVVVMARIDDLWFVAEQQIRADDPNDVFNFEQAIILARTGVERRRPADASKGYKILTGVIDDYFAEG